MIRLKLYNKFDKYEYTIPLDFFNYKEYQDFTMSIKFYEFILELKEKYGRIYVMYDDERGVDPDTTSYFKYTFNEEKDFKKSVILWKRFFYNNGKLIKNKRTMKDLNIKDIKLSLKFEFRKNNEVDIKLVFIKQTCLKYEQFGIYRDYEKDFSVWTCNTFLFDDRQLRLPDEKNIDSNMKTTCVFRDEEHKRQTLKNLYGALHNWSNKNSGFKDKGEVVLDDEYWYVL